MSETIDYGIDLGTTNSAIARYQHGELIIFKNQYQQELTPSAVRIESSGQIVVGQPAYQLLFADFQNTDSGFKRWLGQSDPRYFKAANQSLTAEQLSAEVLKSLLKSVQEQTTQVVKAAVITVPAAFGQLQCEATARAAQVAGLIQAPLLQEPLAAAIAYGMQPDNQDTRWLVYDLGGGTFDIAVVSTKAGQLSVLEHQGHNMLGGLDFDRLLVRKILWPKLQEQFSLPAPDRATNAYRPLIQVLHQQAEAAKIAFSQADSTRITIDNAGVDEKGQAIVATWEINQTEFNSLVTDLVAKTIQLCRQAISNARMTPNDIAKIILVGGPTQLPIIRSMLSAELGRPLDFSLDPMTVVARGAAIYAATLPLQKQPNLKANSLTLNLAYEPVWPELDCLVAGRLESSTSGATEICLESVDGSWTSGWLPINEGYFETSVRLLEAATRQFSLRVRDQQHKLLDINPSSFFIRHGLTLSEPPLPHSIGTEFVRPDGTTAIEIIFPRSTPLPAQTIVHCKADKTLRPSQPEEYIAIKIWEGEMTEPEANTWVGVLKIGADQLRRPLPEGADIELSIAINASRLMEVEAFIPLLNQHFRDGVYIPEQSKEAVVEKVKKIEFELDRQLFRLETLMQIARDASSQWVNELTLLKIRLEDQYLEHKQRFLTGYQPDPAEAKVIFEEFRAIRIRTNEIEQALKSNSKLRFVVRQLEVWRTRTADVVEHWGDRLEKKEYQLLYREAERVVEREDERAIERITEEMENLCWSIRLKQYEFWQECFEILCRPYYLFTNKELAEQYLTQGHRAITEHDEASLKEAVQQLCRLVQQDEGSLDRQRILRAGIRRG